VPPFNVEHLVVKPSLSCTANCPTCSLRRQLHDELKRQRKLSLADWRKVLAEARDLGVWHLTISGGEPTLYPRLIDIIRIGRGYGWLVRMNSNGGFTRQQYGEQLVQAGLNVVDISLYGSTPSLHDSMKRSEGLWHKATANIGMFADLQKRNPGFKVMTQTVLCRENYRDFAELLKLCRQLGSSGLLVSYLEGDFEGDHLLTARQIEEFRRDILPEAVGACRDLDGSARELAVSSVLRIFSPKVLAAEMWAGGVYRPERHRCGIPGKQALVLANGDVHPCNIVEYTHDPVMGNLFSHSLREVWDGRTWREFRRSGHRDCHLCPMGHHVFVPLQPVTKVRGLVKAGLHKLHLDGLESLLYPAFRKARVMASRTFFRQL
jgi:radical SAM protein with 4Fe4S-binding SPASM domain